MMNWDDNGYDDWQGPRCICGQYVVMMHSDCRALLNEDQFNDWVNGRPIRPLKGDY